MNTTKTVNWMLDEVMADVPPSKWEDLIDSENQLIKLIGNEGLEHDIVNPLPCLLNLADQLKGREFSCIVDLTGWMGGFLKAIFPNTEIISSFTLSRVRSVSAPMLRTTGFRVGLGKKELAELKNHGDFSQTLIVDDVGFSGWTSMKTMEMLGLNPVRTSHAILIANQGRLGPDTPGAVEKLQSVGSKVFAGKTITTPDDDGWHLKDLVDHPEIEQGFTTAMEIQERLRNHGEKSLETQMFVRERIAQVCPQMLTTGDLLKMQEEERFISLDHSLLKDGNLHTRNPLLWMMPQFAEHLDLDKIRAERNQIIGILRHIRSMLSGDADIPSIDPADTRKQVNARFAEIAKKGLISHP